MAEYIEREAALDVVNGWREQLIPTYGINDEYVKCLETVAEYLESLHAADVRPVVLCKDCKYCRKVDEYEYWCDGFCSPARLVRKDDFCSHGSKCE